LILKSSSSSIDGTTLEVEKLKQSEEEYLEEEVIDIVLNSGFFYE
jgi:hypothetical protein